MIKTYPFLGTILIFPWNPPYFYTFGCRVLAALNCLFLNKGLWVQLSDFSNWPPPVDIDSINCWSQLSSIKSAQNTPTISRGDGDAPQLMVDGFLSNQPGSHLSKISKSWTVFGHLFFSGPHFFTPPMKIGLLQKARIHPQRLRRCGRDGWGFFSSSLGRTQSCPQPPI